MLALPPFHLAFPTQQALLSHSLSPVIFVRPPTITLQMVLQIKPLRYDWLHINNNDSDDDNDDDHNLFLAACSRFLLLCASSEK